MTETGATPPGWYVDNAGQRRWWDGFAWTEHVDTGQAAGAGYGQAAYAQQQGALLPWPPPYYLEGGPSDFGGAVRNAIQHTFEYANGWIGFFGWVDTPAPAFALAAWGAAMFVLVAGALLVGRRTQRWGLILLMIAFVLVPAVSQALVITSAGFIWQGRYTLALVIMLIVASGIVLDRSGLGAPHRLLARAATLTVWVLAFAQVYTFFVAVKRYVVGETAFIKFMFTQPHWQPPLGWLPLTIGLAVMAIVAALVMTRTLYSVDRRWSRTVSRRIPAELR